MREWLVEIRKGTGQSQAEVAERSKIAQSTYAGFESGARNPRVETARKIAQTLGFDWTRFFE